MDVAEARRRGFETGVSRYGKLTMPPECDSQDAEDAWWKGYGDGSREAGKRWAMRVFAGEYVREPLSESG